MEEGAKVSLWSSSDCAGTLDMAKSGRRKPSLDGDEGMVED